MTNWLCVLLFVYATYASSEACSCSSGTLSHSYEVASNVFSGTVLGISNDGTALVLITEVFKGSRLVSDHIYIHYSCGAFPSKVSHEGVFFTGPTSLNAINSIFARLSDCTRNGPVNTEEKVQLRTHAFPSTCTNPTDRKVYQQGQSFSKDCNTCTCTHGSIICTKKPCPNSHSTCMWNGKHILDGESYKIDSCNTCSCHKGVLQCTKKSCPLPVPVGSCLYNGKVKKNGELWTTSDTCVSKKCLNGAIHEIRTCRNPLTNSWVVAGPLIGVVAIVLVVSFVAVVRRRVRMSDDDEAVLLENVASDGDEPHFGNGNVNGNAFGNGNGYPIQYAPPQQQTYGNFMGSQMYSTPGWGGQQLQTTPMVLMTQTGEPVVVQVAYM